MQLTLVIQCTWVFIGVSRPSYGFLMVCNTSEVSGAFIFDRIDFAIFRTARGDQMYGNSMMLQLSFQINRSVLINQARYTFTARGLAQWVAPPAS